MQFGKFEISCLSLLIIGFIVMMCFMMHYDNKLNIEKEKTKQLEIQREIYYNKEQVNEF